MSTMNDTAGQPNGLEPSKPRSYRILMIAPTSFFAGYGCHVRILEEARVLQKLGHQVTIVTYRNGKSLPGLDIRRTLPIPWRRDYEVGSSRHKIAFDALLGIKTLQLLVRNRYDVIHAHLHEGALIGHILGRLFNIPVLFDFQGSLTEEMIDHNFLKRDSLFYRPLRLLESYITRTSRVIFTSSLNSEHFLQQQFGCQEEQIQVLPDCVDADVFRPAAELDQNRLNNLRARLGIPVDAKVIVYLGLLTPYQGIDLLLLAMQRIVQQQPNVRLLLMGFPNLGVYGRKINELGLAQQVILTGRVPYEEAPDYLALGHLAAAPKLSLTEGAGKLLNYMAMALPTVAFDTPVAREYLGINGFFAERGDLDSLTAQLVQALNMLDGAAEQYTRIGQTLRRRAIEHFEWLQAGRQIESSYAWLAGDSAVLNPAGQSVTQWNPKPR
ncbi:MAG: glycosyltransferase family 4 protein [Caldilineaceae bacterium]